MAPKLRIHRRYLVSGRGAFFVGRSGTVKLRGQQRSENDGMSSEKYEENILTEDPRIPGEGSATQG